ncbi:MAG: hypothetical protein K8H88_14580, partial [Sandaracinaceae bacterium]|nr:hypothetical protein [Sandaracinaceae bacterium]
MGLAERLEEIFAADRAARSAERELMAGSERELIALLAAQAREAVALDDVEESILRSRRLADLCAQIPCPDTVDALLHILDHDDPGVRVEAGEALLSVAYDRFKDVARATEKRLEMGHDGPSM